MHWCTSVRTFIAQTQTTSRTFTTANARMRRIVLMRALLIALSSNFSLMRSTLDVAYSLSRRSSSAASCSIMARSTSRMYLFLGTFLISTLVWCSFSAFSSPWRNEMSSLPPSLWKERRSCWKRMWW